MHLFVSIMIYQYLIIEYVIFNIYVHTSIFAMPSFH